MGIKLRTRMQKPTRVTESELNAAQGSAYIAITRLPLEAQHTSTYLYYYVRHPGRIYSISETLFTSWTQSNPLQDGDLDKTHSFELEGDC